jgi:hypothetical protein
MHQGWPKFVSNMWMAQGDDTLVAVAYGSNEVAHELADGRQVRIVQETDYPFNGRIELYIATDDMADLELLLRIPAWAEGATVAKDGTALSGVVPGEYYSVRDSWHDGDRVTLDLPLNVRSTKWFHNSAAVERGPILFALPIKERWIELPDRSQSRGPAALASGFVDYAIHPQSAWNYALHILDGSPVVREVREHGIGMQPFAPHSPPVEIVVEARQVEEWREVGGNTSPIPSSPVDVSNEETVAVRLVPYGTTRLRISQFPWFVE